jgi:hypothetical protein
MILIDLKSENDTQEARIDTNRIANVQKKNQVLNYYQIARIDPLLRELIIMIIPEELYKNHTICTYMLVNAFFNKE